MAQSMTIPEIKHLVQKVMLRATGLNIAIKDIDIRKVLMRDNDTIAAIWFNNNSMYAGAMCYLIDWDKTRYISLMNAIEYYTEKLDLMGGINYGIFRINGYERN